MAEQVTQNHIQNDLNKNKGFKMHDFSNGFGSQGIQRERSFVRINNNSNNQQNNANKRRSLVFQQQMRGKPALEIYRPPSFYSDVRLDGPQNKLNVHAQEFTMGREQLQNSRSSIAIYPSHNSALLQHSKSSGNMQQQLQMAAARHAVQMAANMNAGGPRTIMVSHPLQLSPIGVAMQTPQMSLVNSTTSGNILHSASRVKFAPEPQIHHTQPSQPQQQPQQQQFQQKLNNPTNSLQRSKSLSSADAIARGLAGLGMGGDATDIGTFIPEIQSLIDQSQQDPNQLNARSLMELANHIMQRAVEGRRYALPTSRFCISIIAKERKETFLESLLNTCRQWYQERDKVLGSSQNNKTNSRPRFTAFMAFLTEMFCQLKRRQLQLRTKCDGVPPPLVLLTLLAKCCEDCVKAPVRSLSEIECLFFVLTCIGRDLESHLPQQLEALLSSVRDAFLNSSASAPAIRRTLLQLIELQASRWQLPGNTVLYYYPSTK
ncbi:uncharacterized protein LOC119076221 isoform X2 [Bradysia coprophila]|uniref:uncharacterized protein LOC119076221 isoform X2 n=1 Tax=Bradysia coprophila TaxID=38358 RepID=UPI00187DC781|nr:uncharacterized protein LOC119076221 isoform X2 [Bradysia coprophila]